MNKDLIKPSELPSTIISQITAVTPPQAIHQIKDPDTNFKADYVSGDYIRSRLNTIFNHFWSQESVDKWQKGKEVLVLVRVTIILPAVTITKQCWGGDQLQWKRGEKQTDENVNGLVRDAFTKAMKSAETDGLKRCAFSLGIANDLRQWEDVKLGSMYIPTGTDELLKIIYNQTELGDLQKLKEDKEFIKTFSEIPANQKANINKAFRNMQTQLTTQ